MSPAPAAGVLDPDPPHFMALAAITINHRPRSVPSPPGMASSTPSHPRRHPHLQELAPSPPGSAPPPRFDNVYLQFRCKIVFVVSLYRWVLAISMLLTKRIHSDPMEGIE
jgi:hypothetical protein